jgi:hypothetical protein
MVHYTFHLFLMPIRQKLMASNRDPMEPSHPFLLRWWKWQVVLLAEPSSCMSSQFAAWHIWKQRNGIIFDNHQARVSKDAWKQYFKHEYHLQYHRMKDAIRTTFLAWVSSTFVKSLCTVFCFFWMKQESDPLLTFFIYLKEKSSKIYNEKSKGNRLS